MRSPKGMIYSATDADSEGKEGRFFIWTPEQLIEVLGEQDAEMAQALWNVTGEGNFEGTSSLYTSQSLNEIAKKYNIRVDQLNEKIDNWTEAMRVARETREHPLRDEKIISSWNGMKRFA
ncbi:MAG: hypothetical protein AB8B84_06285 [Granulosicoccus sp.]